MATDDRRSRLEEAGRWLRRERLRRGFETAGALAAVIGVDSSRISQYERGMGQVPDERAAQIANVFGLDEITVRRNLGLWVPDDDQSEPESIISRIRFSDPNDQQWWDDLNDSGRQRILRMGREADEQLGRRRAG